MIAARRRLHDRGFTAPLRDAVGEMIGGADTVLEVGCGEGFYIGSLARQGGYGVDISTPAIDAAARRYRDCEFVVANADRFLPYADESFSVVMSIAARMNPVEFRRVLQPDGCLLVGVPAPDDLIELRGKGRDRVARTVEEFAKEFRLVDQRRSTTEAELDAGCVKDALTSIYRPMQTEPARALRVTFMDAPCRSS